MNRIEFNEDNINLITNLLMKNLNINLKSLNLNKIDIV
jgi:hypothetical protein